MLMTCSCCSNYAQWAARKASHIIVSGHPSVSWELIAMLCPKHKQEQEDMGDNILRFTFIGAAVAWH